MKQMSFKEYTALLASQVETFNKRFEEQPRCSGLVLPEGDWFEQFITWLDSQDDVSETDK